ncbi:MAG: hypothetical protein WCP85_22970 [Mariniphaga sp.]
MKEQFKKRLILLANVRATQLNFTFTPFASDDLKTLVNNGVDRMSQFELKDESKKALAELNLFRLVEAMAGEARKRNINETLDYKSFSDARMSLCPLWPFC